jgi:hypothetical protein
MAEFEDFLRTCEEKHNSDRSRLDKLENTVNRIYEILDKYKQRPSWIVADIIIFLATALGISVTELVHILIK